MLVFWHISAQEFGLTYTRYGTEGDLEYVATVIVSLTFVMQTPNYEQTK